MNGSFSRADIEARVKWVADLVASGGGALPANPEQMVILEYSVRAFDARERANVVTRYLQDEGFRQYLDAIREAAIAAWGDSAGKAMQYDSGCSEGDSGYYGQHYDAGTSVGMVVALLRQMNQGMEF